MSEEKFVSYDRVIDSVKDSSIQMFLRKISENSPGNPSPSRFLLKPNYVCIYWDLEPDFVIQVLVTDWGGFFYLNENMDTQFKNDKPGDFIFDEISKYYKTYKRSKWLQNELGEYSSRVKWSKDWMVMSIGHVSVYPFEKDDVLIVCHIGSIQLETKVPLNSIAHDLKNFMNTN